MSKVFSLFVLFPCIFSVSVFSQVQKPPKKDSKTEEKKPKPQERKKVELSPQMKSNLRSFLDQTNDLILNLNSNSNRAYFSMRAAKILREIDKSAAQKMYRVSTEAIRKSLLETESEIDQLEQSGSSDFSKLSLQGDIWQKFADVVFLSKSLSDELLENDANFAYTFFHAMSLKINNKQLRRNFEKGVAESETNLLKKIAKDDLDRATKLSAKRLKERGFFDDSIGILALNYEKDAKASQQFADKLVESLKPIGAINETTYSVVQGIWNIGTGQAKKLEEEGSNKKPILSKDNLRDIAEVLDVYQFRMNQFANESIRSNDIMTQFAPMNLAVFAEFVKQSEATSKIQKTQETPLDRSLREKTLARDEFRKELSIYIRPLYSKETPVINKEEIVDQTLFRIEGITNRQTKFDLLIWFAQSCVGAKENESATRVLAVAELMSRQGLPTATDFDDKWAIAGIYSLFNTDKSFEFIDQILFQQSFVINGFAVYAAYLGGSLASEEGEIKLLAFPNSRIYGAGNFQSKLVKRLGDADFSRLNLLPDRIERIEFKVQIRLLIAESLIAPEPPEAEVKTK
jgi:hypothetical protein